MATAGIEGALYEDANDPQGDRASLRVTRDPNFFVDTLRPLLNQPAVRLAGAEAGVHDARADYAIGYEPDLAEAILHRPRRTVLNRDWPWAVWYPAAAQRAVRAAAARGAARDPRRARGDRHVVRDGDYAHDVRLACYGLDKNDNDFVIGLLGKALFPLSHIVQAMRKTQQTSLYLDRLGPFFVGRAVWQSPA